MLNSSISWCLFIGTGQLSRQIPNNKTINLDNASIALNKHVKNLGMYMDRHMSFDVNIHEI